MPVSNVRLPSCSWGKVLRRTNGRTSVLQIIKRCVTLPWCWPWCSPWGSPCHITTMVRVGCAYHRAGAGMSGARWQTWGRGFSWWPRWGSAQWKAQREWGLFFINRACQLRCWAEMPHFQRTAQIWLRAVEDCVPWCRRPGFAHPCD